LQFKVRRLKHARPAFSSERCMGFLFSNLLATAVIIGTKISHVYCVCLFIRKN